MRKWEFLFFRAIGKSTLKRKNLPYGANSFFKRRPHFQRDLSSKEANRKSQKLFPLST